MRWAKKSLTSALTSLIALPMKRVCEDLSEDPKRKVAHPPKRLGSSEKDGQEIREKRREVLRR